MFKNLEFYLKLLPYAVLIAIIVYLSLMNINLKGEIVLKEKTIHNLNTSKNIIEQKLQQQREELEAKIFETESNCNWENAVEDIGVIMENITTTEQNATSVDNNEKLKPGVYEL